MSVSKAEIERIARLASLAVEPELLAELTKQIGDILEYVAQLNSVEMDEAATEFRAGPGRALLREDHVEITTLQPGPALMAPEFGSGYYLVPKLEALGEDA